MLKTLLSGDYPRSRPLTVVLLLMFLCLALGRSCSPVPGHFPPWA